MTPARLRPLLHATTALILLTTLWSWDLLRLVTTAMAIAGLGVEVVRLRMPAVHGRVAAWVPVFRPAEARQLSGAAWLGIGYALAAWLPAPLPAGGILVGALADPAGALVGGRLAGAHGKSWPGTAAVWCTAGVVLVALGWSWPVAGMGATVAAVTERWSAPLNDNLVVAPTVGLILWAAR